MPKGPLTTSFNRRESCAGGCLLIFIAVLGICIALDVANKARFLKTQPSESDILGRWHVTSIQGSVPYWLKQGGNAVRRGTHVETPPNSDKLDVERQASRLDHGWIEFRPHGKLAAHALPWLLEGETCYRVSDVGNWELWDARHEGSMVKWRMEVQLHGTTQGLVFRKDSKGIYLDIPIDLEAIDSVALRKDMD